MSGLRIKDGYMFATGVLLMWLVFQAMSWACDRLYPVGFDDSDVPPKRSRLTVRTDALTGCQYFTTMLGSITPRLDPAGKQICLPK